MSDDHHRKLKHLAQGCIIVSVVFLLFAGGCVFILSRQLSEL